MRLSNGLLGRSFFRPQDFAAQIILSFGSSIEQLWRRAAEEQGEAVAIPEIKRIIAQAKPGFLLLVAQKSLPC